MEGDLFYLFLSSLAAIVAFLALVTLLVFESLVAFVTFLTADLLLVLTRDCLGSPIPIAVSSGSDNKTGCSSLVPFELKDSHLASPLIKTLSGNSKTGV